MSEPFNDNVYTIDLSHVKTAAEIVYDLAKVLDTEDAFNKKVCLKLGEIDLNQSQLSSIKSLINSMSSTLTFIDTKSQLTKSAATGLGIVVTNPDSQEVTETQEPEMTYKTIDEMIQSIEDFPNAAKQDVLENEIFENEEQEDINDVVEVDIPSTPREYEKLEDEVELSSDKEEIEPESEVIAEPSTKEEVESQEALDVIFDAEQRLEQMFEKEVPVVEEIVTDTLSSIVASSEEFTEQDFELDSFQTKYIKQTIRSGQVIDYDGHVVIIGDCHPGSEIKAKGDIAVWGVLSGIAHAGSEGNEKARIRALNMNAIQLRIANCYARRPDTLNVIFVEKTNSFTPEEARIINGEIVIFKIND